MYPYEVVFSSLPRCPVSAGQKNVAMLAVRAVRQMVRVIRLGQYELPDGAKVRPAGQPEKEKADEP